MKTIGESKCKVRRNNKSFLTIVILMTIIIAAINIQTVKAESYLVGPELALAGFSADIAKKSADKKTEKNESNSMTEKETEVAETEEEFVWDGPVLNAYLGTIAGPSGKETYYNLPMGGVISIMRNEGFSEEEYPYWERDDGCKMLGDYIMVAADLSIRPRGSLIDCSLGKAIVCDTGEFIYSNPMQLDIAVNW